MDDKTISGTTIDEIARALVRPIVTVLFASGFVWFTWMGLISGDVFAGAALMVISFWFASRNQEKTDEKAAALQTEIVKKLPDNPPLPPSS